MKNKAILMGRIKEKVDGGVLLETMDRGNPATIFVKLSEGIISAMAEDEEGTFMGVEGIPDQAPDGSVFLNGENVRILRKKA